MAKHKQIEMQAWPPQRSIVAPSVYMWTPRLLMPILWAALLLTFLLAGSPGRAHAQTGPINTFTYGNDVLGLAFSPDGRYLAVGYYDDEVSLVDLLTGTEVRRFKAYGYVMSVAFSPDGQYLAAADLYYSVWVWNVQTGAKLYDKETGGYVREVAISPDGRFLVAAEDEYAYVWELTTGVELYKFEIYYGHGAAISPDSRYLAMGTEQNRIHIWDLTTGNAITTLTGLATSDFAYMVSVDFSPDGRYLAAADDDDSVFLIDAGTWTLVRTIQFPEGINAVDFSPNSKYLATFDNEGLVRVWEVETGTEVMQYDHSNGTNSDSMSGAFSPTGLTIASGGDDNKLKLWPGITCLDEIPVTHSADSGDGSLRVALANVCEGGRITFAPITFSQPATITLASQIEITKSVTISGAGSQNVIVSGNNVTRAFSIGAGADVTIEGITLRDGNVSAGNGGAIYVDDGSLRIIGVQFVENYAAGNGGAFFMNGAGSLSITDSGFISNTAQGTAGAVQTAGDLTIADSRFERNVAGDRSGAVFVNGSLTLTNTDFLSNTAANSAGAMTVVLDAVVFNSRFVGNRAIAAWAGALTVEGAQATIIDSDFENNQANHMGALEAWSNLTIVGSRFVNNVSDSYSGAVMGYENVSITDSLFQGNRAVSEGGALYVDTGLLRITNTDFLSNTVGSYGGAIYSRGFVSTTNSRFVNNQASVYYGGAIYHTPQLNNCLNGSCLLVDNVAFSRNSATDEGGALYLSFRGTGIITNTTFEENSSGDGGGAFVYYGHTVAPHGSLSIINSNFFGNVTQAARDGYGGGAAYIYGPTQMEGVTLAYNSGVGYGGAIYTGGSLGAARLTNVTLYSNTATIAGGAIYFERGGLLHNTTLSDNAAAEGGGLYVAPNQTAVLTNTLVVNSIGGEFAGPGTVTGSHNLTGTLAMGPMQNNGGPTWTLLPGLTAIDAGLATACPAIDQRGVARPSGNGCDIGAVEMTGSGLSLLEIPDDLKANAGDTVDIPVNFTAYGGNIAAIDFTLTYPTDCLSLDLADSDADGLPDSFVLNQGGFVLGVDSTDAANGSIRLIVSPDVVDPVPFFADDTLLTIPIEVAASCRGVIDLSLNAATWGDNLGQSVTANTKNGAIIVNAPPVAQPDTFNGDEDEGSLSGNVLADNGSTADSDPDGDLLIVSAVDGNGANVDQAVTLADGVQVTIQSNGVLTYTWGSTFDFLAVGETQEYSVTYVVSDGIFTDTATINLVVAGENDTPTVDAGAEQWVGVGETLMITGTVTDLDANDNHTFAYDWGDGTQTTGAVGSHSYNAPADHTLTVTAEDPAGAAHTDTTSVYVRYRGDCNGDGPVDAGDLPAFVLEYFDGDSNDNWLATLDGASGSYSGAPAGCDANADTIISAGDLSCQINILLDPVGYSCVGVGTASTAQAVLALANVTGAAVGEVVRIPVSLQTNGYAVVAAVFSLNLGGYAFDATDADGNGLPDAVIVTQPGDVQAIAIYNAEDVGSELDLVIFSSSLTPFQDGDLLAVTLKGAEAAVTPAFSTSSPVSLGASDGTSIPVVTQAGITTSNKLFLPLTTR